MSRAPRDLGPALPVCHRLRRCKQYERRSVEWTMWWPARVKSRAFSAHRAKAAEPAAAKPAPRRSVVQELDLTLDNPTDRALFQLSILLSELRSAIRHHGPCRPKGLFVISSDNGNRRIISETHCYAHSGAMEI